MKPGIFIDYDLIKIKIMKLLVCMISFSAFLISCQNPTEKNLATKNTTVIQNPSNQNFDSTKKNIIKEEISADTSSKIKSTYHLSLTSNALQLINSQTGSSTEINFGKPLDEMVETINKVLQSKVSTISINSECGAGPLKMAVWKNGLNLIFKEQKSNKEWQFVGWHLGKASGNMQTLKTMAGIGIGSTRQEMESAYVIKVNKTSLGNEFSTSSGLYGIFDGQGKDAKITDLWSGLTCIFR